MFHELFADNPDARDARFAGLGVYAPGGGGLAKVHFSWGHDQYFFQASFSVSLLQLWRPCVASNLVITNASTHTHTTHTAGAVGARAL